MAEINNAIAEASQDLQTIEDFVNLPSDSEVYPRLLPSVNVGTLAGARQAIFEAGGLPATPFASKALMTASALVDGDYAMVTDGGADNGLYLKTAGVWVKSAYDPVELSKQASLLEGKDKIKSYDSTALVKKNENHIGEVTQNYDSTDLIPVKAGQILVLKSQVFNSPNYYRFTSALGVVVKNSTINVNGVFQQNIVVPKNAAYFKVISANSNREGYIPNSFNLDIYQKVSDSISKTVDISYSYFLENANKGNSAGTNPTAYRHLVLPFVEGDSLVYSGLQVLIAPTVIQINKTGQTTQTSTASDGVMEALPDAAWVVIDCMTPEHTSFDPSIAKGFNLSLLSNAAADKYEKDLETQLKADKIYNAYKKDFGLATVYNGEYEAHRDTYSKTIKIPVTSSDTLFFKTKVLGILGVVYGYDQYGVQSEVVATTGSSEYPLAQIIKIPDNIVAIEVTGINSKHASYDPNYELTVVVGEGLGFYEYLKEYYYDQLALTFPLVGNIESSNMGYNSTDRIYLHKGMVFDYSVNALGSAAKVHSYETGEDIILDPNSGTYEVAADGWVQLSTFNSTHARYDANFKPSFSVNYSKDPSITENKLIDGSYLSTPVLKCIREVTFTDGTDKMAIEYLWQKDHKFFISSSKYGEKALAFIFDTEVFGNFEPHHYSMNFDAQGNIICVYRTEYLARDSGDVAKRNPIVLVRENNFEAVEIDFGEDLKPSGWLQNSGFISTDNYLMFTEYTRPSVDTANTWKVSYPITDRANWKIVQSFTVYNNVDNGDEPNVVKHLHSVNRDPYTGYIYTSSGDEDRHAKMFVSKDNGETFTQILENSQKYCRTLNFIFDKDFIYWATDSHGSVHYMFKAPRTADGVLDIANVVDIELFATDSSPTYAAIMMRSIDAILLLGRSDGAANSVMVDVFDLTTQSIKRIDEIPTAEGVASTLGFRCECFEYYPRDNECIVGFSKALGGGGYENKLGILGNKMSYAKKVNNVVMTLNRVGLDFTITYKTIK